MCYAVGLGLTARMREFDRSCSNNSWGEDDSNVFLADKKPTKAKRNVALFLLTATAFYVAVRVLGLGSLEGLSGEDRHSSSISHRSLETASSSVSGLRRATRVYEWSSRNSKEIKRHRINTMFVLFFDQNQPVTSQNRVRTSPRDDWLSIITGLSNHFASKEILHVMVEKEHLSDFSFFLPEDAIGGLPFSVIVNVDKDDGLVPSLESFEEDYHAHKLTRKRWLRTENWEDLGGDESLTAPGPPYVKEIVGSQFDRLVINKKMDVIVFFYAAWCGYCKNLQPRLEELAKLYQNAPSLIFLRIDITKNDVDHPSVAIHRVPYVRMFPAFHKETPIRLDHADPDIVENGKIFIREHADIPLVGDDAEL